MISRGYERGGDSGWYWFGGCLEKRSDQGMEPVLQSGALRLKKGNDVERVSIELHGSDLA